MNKEPKSIFQIIEENQMRRDLAFLTRPVEHTLKFYESLFLVMPSFGVTVMIFPSSVDIEHTLDLLDNTRVKDNIAALHGNLVPTKSKQIVYDMASGKKRILFTTPEHFYFWFRFAIDNTQDISFDDKLLHALIDILNRMQLISIHTAQLASPTNTQYKDKFNKFLARISKLNKRFMLFYDQDTEGFDQYLAETFAGIEQHKYELSAPEIYLSSIYEISEQAKQKRLLSILTESQEPTIIYVSSLATGKISDLSSQLHKRNIEHQVYHEYLPPEVKSETLEAYLRIEQPCMLVTDTAKVLPYRTQIKRIIFYGLPVSTHQLYQEVISFGGRLKQCYILASEKDFQALQKKSVTIPTLPAHQSAASQVKINYKKLKQEFFQLVCENSGCLWDSVEDILTGTHYGISCQNCSNCLPDKGSNSFMKSISKFMIKSKLKI